jgi:hypothetical protein
MVHDWPDFGLFTTPRKREKKMNKSVLAAIVSAFALSACGPSAQDAKKLNPDNPQVSVVGGKIAIDQETIRFAKDKQNVKITWQLPADSKYTFPKDGIAIKDGGDEFPDCHPEQNGLRFACMNKHSKPGKYKYTITVDGSPAVPPLDPIIDND